MKTSLTIDPSFLHLALRRQQQHAARPCLLHRLFPSLAPVPRRDRGVHFSPTEIVHSIRSL